MDLRGCFISMHSFNILTCIQDCGSFLYGDFYYDDAAEFEELANNLSDGHCQHPIGSKTRSGNTIPLAQLPSSSSMTSANARPSSLVGLSIVVPCDVTKHANSQRITQHLNCILSPLRGVPFHHPTLLHQYREPQNTSHCASTKDNITLLSER